MMDWKDNTVVFILAAGLGSRLGEITQNIPKALVSLNDVPLLAILLQKVKQEGFRYCIINVHHFAPQIIEFLRVNDSFGLDIQISDETAELLDTGGALIKAKPMMKQFDYLLVHNVDIVSDVSFSKIYSDFIDSQADASLLVRDRKSGRKLMFDSNMQLCGWHHLEENQYKKTIGFEQSGKEYAFSGVHLLKTKLLENLPLKKCSIIDLYLQFAEKYRIKGFLHNEGFWFDLGKKHEIDAIAMQLRQVQTQQSLSDT